MQSPLKILFVDDHTGLRDGMIFMLQSKNPDFKITGVGTAQEAIQKLTEDNEIRVVILDMNLDGESSLNSLAQMKAANPNASILVYTMYNDELHIQDALMNGIQGVVTKEAPIEELEKAIIAVSNGNTYLNSVATKAWNSLLLHNSGIHTARTDKEYVFDNYRSLSKKELEIFYLLLDNLDIPKIAKRLGKSEKTIRNQRTAIYDKMCIHDRHDLITKAKILGLPFKDKS